MEIPTYHHIKMVIKYSVSTILSPLHTKLILCIGYIYFFGAKCIRSVPLATEEIFHSSQWSWFSALSFRCTLSLIFLRHSYCSQGFLNRDVHLGFR